MTSDRLYKTIAAIAPIHGMSVGIPGNSLSVRIDFKPEATPVQKAAAQVALAAFDWSQAAQDAWDDAQNPNRTGLREAAVAAVQENTAYLAIANPSNIMVISQVRALTQQMNVVIKRLSDIL